eukprot:CAMPEP_0201551888 /NCGR_PEP_ID=MMETSP0173_2-20130828/12122_1 /ASSEMBLY_ACC=CAM_ASM_000268 /TAXON_ID=218659 /ORGANISM="Vexillifera sp., Strain DIVA3 564/2" /LENGTH=89 /DNA_ID=CAMNT_0047962247 /DNA_START=46 /DNA_END=315 /DNA_ORIENTATION=+
MSNQASSSTTTTTSTTTTQDNQRMYLEADDEFEEFENEWTPAEIDKQDKQQWEEDWDDDADTDDDFSKQLRAELDKISKTGVQQIADDE